MEMEQIKLKIFLNQKKTPIIAIINDEKYIEMLLSELNAPKEYIKFGNIMFKKTDFVRCEIKD